MLLQALRTRILRLRFSFFGLTNDLDYYTFDQGEVSCAWVWNVPCFSSETVFFVLTDWSKPGHGSCVYLILIDLGCRIALGGVQVFLCFSSHCTHCVRLRPSFAILRDSRKLTQSASSRRLAQ